MKKCAFLTTDSLEGYVSDDQLALPALARQGWQVEWVSWRRAAVDWDRFDLVLIRTPWDYQNHPHDFLETLTQIDDSNARLANPLSLVRWNLDKRYMIELAGRGLPVVPTRYYDNLHGRSLPDLFTALDCDEMVLKPVIGASAHDTLRLRRGDDPAPAQALFERRPFLAQKFMPIVLEEGEFSMIFFLGEHSHSLLKTPRRGDFRSQEEYGSHVRLVEPEPALLRAGQELLAQIQTPALYARVDMLRDPGQGFLLMELELIEPALYFRIDPNSPDRFADAIQHWMRETGAG